MERPELSITYLPIDELVPYAGNAKRHPPEQIEQIAASMREFGDCDPVGIWRDGDGRPLIVEGHGRVMALRELGIDTVPTIDLSHLTDAQRRAYAHVHNQTTLTSGFDIDVLEAEMGELPEFDWEGFGFDTFDFDGYLDDLMEDGSFEPERGVGGEFFSVSLVFPNEERDSVMRWLRGVGKEEVERRMLEEARQWG